MMTFLTSFVIWCLAILFFLIIAEIALYAITFIVLLIKYTYNEWKEKRKKKKITNLKNTDMLKQETFNAIVNYLATRPYQDVAHLFTMIQNDIEQQQMTNNSPTAIEEENNE